MLELKEIIIEKCEPWTIVLDPHSISLSKKRLLENYKQVLRDTKAARFNQGIEDAANKPKKSHGRIVKYMHREMFLAHRQ